MASSLHWDICRRCGKPGADRYTSGNIKNKQNFLKNWYGLYENAASRYRAFFIKEIFYKHCIRDGAKMNSVRRDAGAQGNKNHSLR